MGIGMVARHIWAPKGARQHGHWKGARAYMGTVRVPRHIWAPEGCLGIHGHREGARAHMGTRRVHEHIWTPKGCQGIYGYQGSHSVLGWKDPKGVIQSKDGTTPAKSFSPRKE